MVDFFQIFDGIVYFFNSVADFFGSDTLAHMIFWLKIFSGILSVVFMAGIVYSIIKGFAIMKKRKIGELLDIWSELPIEKRATRWASVIRRLESPNPVDWNMAVLEADSILDDIMKKIGYEGATLGERLSKIEPSDFESLQEVWEAHKVRNRIAHEAADFKMEREEAERVIKLFEKGLRELEYIS